MSHVTYMITYTNESCRTCEFMYEWVMSHIYEWVMSHTWLHIRTSHVTGLIPAKRKLRRSSGEGVMSHINESFPQYERVMLTIWIRHVTHMNTYTNELCHTYACIHECLMSQIWLHLRMSHATRVIPTERKLWRSSEEVVMSRIHESCTNYKWVMLHIRMSHVTRVIRDTCQAEAEALFRFKSQFFVNCGNVRHTHYIMSAVVK